MTLETGRKYLIAHSSGLRVMTFQGERILAQRRGYYGNVTSQKRTHYMFRNDTTGRDIELKSTQKVRSEA